MVAVAVPYLLSGILLGAADFVQTVSTIVN